MKLRWSKMRKGGGLDVVDPEEAHRGLEKKTAAFWADVESYETDELDAWLVRLGASEATRECCLAVGETPRVVVLDQAVFFEFPVFQDGADSDTGTLGFLCQDRLVVTFHPRSVAELEKVVETLRGPGVPRLETTVALVTVILLSLSSKANQIARSLRDTVYALDERMDRDADEVDARDILERKRAVRNLDTVVDEQLAMFGLVGALRPPYLNMESASSSFEVMSRAMSFAQRAVDRLEKHLSDLQVRYDVSRQEKTNQHLALLTVISAIFLPLTLVTGIYGMNFDRMPELHLSYGYPAAVGLMVTIAAGLYWYFRRGGWLD